MPAENGLSARPVSVSIRDSVRSLEFATHTEPSPAAIAFGWLPTRMRPISAPPALRGSICETVPSKRVRHPHEPAAHGDADGPAADRDRLHDLVVRVDPRDRALTGVGDPDRALADRDAPGRGAGRERRLELLAARGQHGERVRLDRDRIAAAA